MKINKKVMKVTGQMQLIHYKHSRSRTEGEASLFCY